MHPIAEIGSATDCYTAKVSSGEGLSTLQHALYSRQTKQALALIDRMSPEQLSKQDARGQTALHHAVSADCDDAIIEALLNAMPQEAIAARDYSQQTALLCCVAKGEAGAAQALQPRKRGASIRGPRSSKPIGCMDTGIDSALFRKIN